MQCESDSLCEKSRYLEKDKKELSKEISDLKQECNFLRERVLNIFKVRDLERKETDERQKIIEEDFFTMRESFLKELFKNKQDSVE